MRRITLSLGVAFFAHIAYGALALITAVAVSAELHALGVDPADAESVLELFARGGTFNPPVRVLLAGLAAAFFITPLLEAALAAATSGAPSLREILRLTTVLAPASFGLVFTTAVLALGALGFAALAPLSALLLTEELYDDRARLGWRALSALPSVAVLLGAGVAIDAGRVHLAWGGSLLTATAQGVRAAGSRLYPFYVLTLALGIAASVAHASFGRTNDASSLIAGGVVLLVRPLSRAALMLAVARRERSAQT